MLTTNLMSGSLSGIVIHESSGCATPRKVRNFCAVRLAPWSNCPMFPTVSGMLQRTSSSFLFPLKARTALPSLTLIVVLPVAEKPSGPFRGRQTCAGSRPACLRARTSTAVWCNSLFHWSSVGCSFFSGFMYLHNSISTCPCNTQNLCHRTYPL